MRAKLLLAVCFSAFVFISGTQLSTGLKDTWHRLSADDHYSWILKGPQMTECPLGNCRFIKDTRAQLPVNFSDFSYELNSMRWREEHCLFDIYSPLYTVHLILYKNIFSLNWETSFEWVTWTGFTVACLGALFFLTGFFGTLPAAFAFICLSLNYWGYARFAAVSPSFIVTGLALLLFSFLHKKPRQFLFLLPLIIPFISLYHSIGKVYAAVFLLITFFIFFEDLVTKTKSRALWLLSCISFTAMILLGFVSKPQFKLIKLPFNTENDLFQHFAANLHTMVSYLVQNTTGPVHNYTISLLGSLIFIFLVLILSRSRKKLTVIPTLIGLALLSVTLVSVFHFLRNYPGELTSRLFIPFYVFLCGSMGLLFILILDSQAKLGRRVAAALLCAVFLKTVYSHHTDSFPMSSLRSDPKQLRLKDSVDNLYDPSQVAKIFDTAGNCGTVLYLDQTPMWFYSSYGALKCGAIVGYVWPTPYHGFTRLVEERTDLSHAVLMHPLYSHGGLPYINPDKKISFSFDETPSEEFKVTLKTRAKGVRLKLASDGETKILEIAPNQVLEHPIAVKKGMTLEMSAEHGEALVQSAKYGGSLNWPWARKVIVHIKGTEPSGNTVDLKYDFLKWAERVFYYVKADFEIIDDNYASLLIKIKR